MVIWHIKLKTRIHWKILTYDKNGDPGMGSKGQFTIRFLPERGDLRWRAIECVLVIFFFIIFIIQDNEFIDSVWHR